MYYLQPLTNVKVQEITISKTIFQEISKYDFKNSDLLYTNVS